MTVATDMDRDLALRLRIEALMADYIHSIDEDRLEEWPDYFTKDGQYRVISRENYELNLPMSLIYCEGQGMFRDRISALRTANVFEPHTYCHMTSALKIVGSDGSEHRTQSNFTVMRTMSEGAMSVFACGKYIDRIAEDSGGLKFRERSIILDSRRIDTLLVIPI
jgi:anthranilate 1,2-dioxygenase small subunit